MSANPAVVANVEIPAVSANPAVVANVEIPAKSENVAKPALCELVEKPDIVETPEIFVNVAIPAKSEKVANPALLDSTASIDVDIVPVVNPVIITSFPINTESLNVDLSSTVNPSSVVSPSTFKSWSKSASFWTFKVFLSVAAPSTSSWSFKYAIPSTSRSFLILAAPFTSRGFVGLAILIPTFAVVWIPAPVWIHLDLISISNIPLPASVPNTISPPLRVPIKLIVVNDPTPMFTPSFCAKIPSAVALGGADTQRIPSTSRLKKYPGWPGLSSESKICSSIWIDPPISNFWSGSVLPIPTLPARLPVPFKVKYSFPLLINWKLSVTVRKPTWRLSISGKIALVNVAIPVENKFLKVKSSKSNTPVISTLLKVAIPVTLSSSRLKLSLPSKL